MIVTITWGNIDLSTLEGIQLIISCCHTKDQTVIPKHEVQDEMFYKLSILILSTYVMIGYWQIFMFLAVWEAQRDEVSLSN